MRYLSAHCATVRLVGRRKCRAAPRRTSSTSPLLTGSFNLSSKASMLMLSVIGVLLAGISLAGVKFGLVSQALAQIFQCRTDSLISNSPATGAELTWNLVQRPADSNVCGHQSLQNIFSVQQLAP